MVNFKKLIYNRPKILNLFQIFGGYALQPFFLLIHLTLACNRRCANCYQLNDEFYSSLKHFSIKPDDFEKVLKEAKTFLIRPQIHFFGGEPLLNPYFAELLDLADKYGFKSSLTTNGILLNKNIKNILNSDLDQINVSINNVKERYDSEGNLPGVFDRIIAAIRDLKQRNKGPSKKIVNINCVISENNQGHLVDITKYFIDNNIDIDVLAFQHLYFSVSNKPKIDLSVLTSQIKKLGDLKPKFEIVVIPNIKLKDLSAFYSLDKSSVFKNNCLNPWLGLNILPNLAVTPGGGVLGCNQIVGDLKKNSLKEIWNNPKMRKFRKNIIQHNLPAVCFRCCHRQYY